MIVSLAPYLFRSGDRALGGLIYGHVQIPAAQVTNLLAGLHYINIHTTNYPGGEIRASSSPRINKSTGDRVSGTVTAECGTLTTVTTKVADPEGDALVVVWSVNGTAIQTNELAAGSTTAPVAVNFPAEFPLGTNYVSVVATDSEGNSSTCSTTVTVVDTVPPVIIRVTATPNASGRRIIKWSPVQVDARVDG